MGPRGVVGKLDEPDTDAARGGAHLRIARCCRAQHDGAAPGRGGSHQQGGGVLRAVDPDTEEQVTGLPVDAGPGLGQRHVVDGRQPRIDDDGEQAAAERADELVDGQAHRSRRRRAREVRVEVRVEARDDVRAAARAPPRDAVGIRR